MTTLVSLNDVLLNATADRALSRRTIREMAMLTTMARAARAGRSRAWDTDELARAIGVNKPVITRYCTTLQRCGIVRNVAKPQDKRRRDISLTEAGFALVDRLLAEAPPALAEAA